jgi:hypothetical protein
VSFRDKSQHGSHAISASKEEEKSMMNDCGGSSEERHFQRHAPLFKIDQKCF